MRSIRVYNVVAADGLLGEGIAPRYFDCTVYQRRAALWRVLTGTPFSS
ncbi:MAG: hypothetical protein MZV63_20260 [Marinilabiliales bacterium]|nr:hypothetical protein [Marinilabiliales bacterium]